MASIGAKISAQVRRGWIQIPDIMVGIGIGTVGVTLGLIGLYEKSNRPIEKPFKDHYIVLRDDDPDAQRFKDFHANPKY